MSGDEAAGMASGSLLELRSETADDAEFLFTLYASTRAQELALTNWSDEQKTQFCRQQFSAQTIHYRQHNPAAEFSVILRDGARAGRLYVNREEGKIHIIDISLLPEHRGAGLGTLLLRNLQAEAAHADKALSIYVEKFNPALRLYQRLGFCPKRDEGVYLLMEWRPEPIAPAGRLEPVD
jgi:ribosomal protein S18 acetylase RimI-like enzyme